MMRYYIIAGEASGDLHASNLVKELKKRDANAHFRCWGGDLLQATGATVIKHYRDLAFMGFAEVIANLGTILNNLKFCKKDILNYQPDVLILIDYPGFNLRIAEWAKQQGFKIVYYISPQVWAWKENRVKKIKRSVDLMLVILPFEKDFYTKWNYPVHYVGHPLIEVIDQFRTTHTQPTLSEKPIIALLPGSRKQEILKKLPIMLSVAKHFPQYQFIVAQAPGLDDAFYAPMLNAYSNVSAVRNETYLLLSLASAALVTSGTATLETALFGVPEVVCYKGSSVSYHIAKRLLTIKFISLVNLIMDKPVITELIQGALTTESLVKELNLLTGNAAVQQRIKSDYDQLRHLLSQGGHASANAAGLIMNFLHEPN
jgi:lipid-A-disaccharide synthase